MRTEMPLVVFVVPFPPCNWFDWLPAAPGALGPVLIVVEIEP